MVLVRVRVNRSAISTHRFSSPQGRTQDRRRRLFQGECGERIGVCGLCRSGVQSRVPGQGGGRSRLNLKDFQPLHDQKISKFAQFLLILGK